MDNKQLVNILADSDPITIHPNRDKKGKLHVPKNWLKYAKKLILSTEIEVLALSIYHAFIKNPDDNLYEIWYKKYYTQYSKNLLKAME